MTSVEGQAAAMLAAADQDTKYAAALKTARLAENDTRGSFVEHAARTVAAVESLARRAESIAAIRKEKGRSIPTPRPTIMRDVYDLTVILNNALCDAYEEGQKDNGE